MQINMRDLEGKLIVEFGYHDSKIIKVAKNKKDIVGQELAPAVNGSASSTTRIRN